MMTDMVAVLLHDNYSLLADTGCTHMRGLFRSDVLVERHLNEVLSGDRSCIYCDDGETRHTLGGCCHVEHMEVTAR